MKNTPRMQLKVPFMFAVILSLLFVLHCPKTLNAQVSKTDREHFARNLDIRRRNQEGINPNEQGALQVPFGNYTYRGVEAVSNKFMLDAYPNQDQQLTIGLFTTIGLDEDVFKKFMFQVFLYCEGDKELTIRMINALCDSKELSDRIFERYWKTNEKEIKFELSRAKEDLQKKTVEDAERRKKSETEEKEAIVYNYVEQMPKFFEKPDDFFKENMHYPTVAFENKTGGRVIIKCVINEDGTVSDLAIVKHLGSGCDEEAERLVKSMSGKWEPGKQNGKAVKVYFTLSIAFNSN